MKRMPVGLRTVASLLILISWMGASTVWAQSAAEIVSQAKSLLREGKTQEAATVLQPVADASPDDVEAHFLLGMAKNELKDYAGAAVALERAKAIDPETPEIRSLLGLAYAEQGDYARALPELEFVFGKAPTTPDVGYRLGKIHYVDTRYPPARDTLNVNVPSSEEIKQRVHYLLGLTYERLGDRAESDKNLKLAVAAAPSTELATKINAILAETPGDGKEKGSSGEPAPTAPLAKRKKFGLDAYASLLHDDNARLDPKNNPNAVVQALRARPGSRDSDGLNLAVRPEYSFHDEDGTRVSVSYFGSHTDYFDVRNLDFTNHQVALNGFHQNPEKVGAPLFSAQLSFDTAELGSADFLDRFTFAPAVTFASPEHPKHATVVFGLLQDRDFKTPVGVVQENRDGTLLAAGFTHYRLIEGGKHNVRIGLQFDRDDADGANYEYDGWRPSIGGTADLGNQFFLSADALFHFRDYDNVNTVFGGRRDDDDTLLIARLSKTFDKGLTAFAEFTHNDVDSNIPVFEFERDVVSAGVHYRY